jgi:hypothetical protein
MKSVNERAADSQINHQQDHREPQDCAGPPVLLKNELHTHIDLTNVRTPVLKKKEQISRR